MANEDGTDTEQTTGTRRRTSKPVAQADGSVKNEEVPELEGPQVRYVGQATRRILTPKDWENVGVDDTEHKTYVWELSNSKMIPKSDFSEKQLAYLMIDDGFEIEEG
jgi:hypothetical protein